MEIKREVDLVLIDEYKKYVKFVVLGYVVEYEYIIYDSFNEDYRSNVVLLFVKFKLFTYLLM